MVNELIKVKIYDCVFLVINNIRNLSDEQVTSIHFIHREYRQLLSNCTLIKTCLIARELQIYLLNIMRPMFFNIFKPTLFLVEYFGLLWQWVAPSCTDKRNSIWLVSFWFNGNFMPMISVGLVLFRSTNKIFQKLPKKVIFGISVQL